VYLYDVHRRRRVELGAFFQPSEYWGSSPYHEWRCDTHPRASRDGKLACIDSPHHQGR